ncbi:MAG: DUF4917 family protein [Candidatus Omnitrophica bacterium]|nr:DUF4917 family protein [Candidatus Omnitrophota bacterium]
MAFDLLSYETVLEKLPQRKHLLLGNGFSISCDPIFSYANLFEYVKNQGLSLNVQKVFEYLGTNNFEGVMKMLEDVETVRHFYNLEYKDKKIQTILEDLDIVKSSLINAIARTHLPHSGKIDEEKKGHCVKFLKPYQNIFTTNYDLLLYWISMHGHVELQERDGFRASIDDPEAEYLVFSEHLGQNKGMLFLHGALHLYMEEGELRKHSWIRSNKTLIELIKEGLDRKQYPLFVAEGKPEKKLDQIHKNGYLSYCLGKLERIQNALVIYGMSLGQSDSHILNTIADNLKIDNLFVGLYGSPNSKENQLIGQMAEGLKSRRKRWLDRNKGGRELFVHYYDSSTAKVWG